MCNIRSFRIKGQRYTIQEITTFFYRTEVYCSNCAPLPQKTGNTWPIVTVLIQSAPMLVASLVIPAKLYYPFNGFHSAIHVHCSLEMFLQLILAHQL